MHHNLLFPIMLFFISCESHHEGVKQGIASGCKEKEELIFGLWVNERDTNLQILVKRDTILYNDIFNNYKESNKMIIFNMFHGCGEELPMHPPSPLMISEIVGNEDTLNHHVLYLDSAYMEWASGNHFVKWVKR